MAVWPGEGAAMEIEGEARGRAGEQQREKVKAAGWRIGAGDRWERARETPAGVAYGRDGKTEVAEEGEGGGGRSAGQGNSCCVRWGGGCRRVGDGGQSYRVGGGRGRAPPLPPPALRSGVLRSGKRREIGEVGRLDPGKGGFQNRAVRGSPPGDKDRTCPAVQPPIGRLPATIHTTHFLRAK